MPITPIGIYFLYYFLSYPDTHLCDPRERNYLTTPVESPTLCIIFDGPQCSSPTGFCQETVENVDFPCFDGSIIAYIPGECQNLAASQLCTEDDRKAMVPDQYSPACAYTSTNRLGGQRINTKTWLLGKSACNSDDTVFHVSGKCEFIDSPTLCMKTENKASKMDSLSCAYYTGGDCTEKVCQKTVEEGTTPCDDSSVMFYVSGACKALKLPKGEDGLPIPVLKTHFQQEGGIIYEVIEEEPAGQKPLQPEVNEPIEAENSSAGQEAVPSDSSNGLEEEPIPVLKTHFEQEGGITYEVIEKEPEEQEPSVPEVSEPVEAESLSSSQETVPSGASNGLEEIPIPELKTHFEQEGGITYEVIDEEPSQPEVHKPIEAENSSSGQETVPSDSNNSFEEEPSVQLLVEKEGKFVKLVESRLLRNEADKEN